MDWPGEKVLTRVIDALENGIGGVLRPWQTRRVAKANAEARAAERLLLEQVEINIADLKAGRKQFDASGKLIDSDVPPRLLLEGPIRGENKLIGQQSSGIVEFAHAAQDAAQAQDLQRAVNLKKIALYAEEEAEEIDRQAQAAEITHEEPQSKMDADWFAKWRTGAQEVSREEMQRLWGKLLAGEVARPGSYSLHTVDFLSRMSSADADLLARVAPFATSGGIIRVGDDFFASHNLSFSDFLYLDDLGLINGTVGVGGLQYTLGHSDFNGRAISTLLCGKHVLIIDMGEVTKSPPKMVFEVFVLTRVGREILTLASIPINMEYLRKICDYAISHEAEEVQVGTLHPDGRQIMWPQTMAKKRAPTQEVG